VGGPPPPPPPPIKTNTHPPTHPPTNQARILVEEGHSNVLLADRWGRTPLDTALKSSAMQVVEYLEGRPEVGQEQREQARQRFEQERTDELLNACMWGDGAMVQTMLARGCPVDARDYDGASARGSGDFGGLRCVWACVRACASACKRIAVKFHW